MKSKLIFLLIISFYMLIMFAELGKSEVQYWQDKRDLGNGTIENFLSLQYSKMTFQVFQPSHYWFCIHLGWFCPPSETLFSVGDYVSGNNPYELYIWYNIYPQKWNTDNPNVFVDNCNFRIDNYKRLQQNSTTILNITYDRNSADMLNEKYFIQLQDGDGISVYQTCYFQNQSYSQLYLPAEMQIVTPTLECKSCQYYEWILQQRNLVKAQNITSNTITTLDYVKKLFSINFEAWLMFFWAFSILMVFVAVSFIFLGLLWFYKYLRRIVK